MNHESESFANRKTISLINQFLTTFIAMNHKYKKILLNKQILLKTFYSLTNF